MSNYQLEELENIRHAAEKGLATALYSRDGTLVDSFQYILDICERVKDAAEANRSEST